jgi:hypothetical protein
VIWRRNGAAPSARMIFVNRFHCAAGVLDPAPQLHPGYSLLRIAVQRACPI